VKGGKRIMQFVTVRDFRNSSKEIWDRLKHDEEIVVTNNGKPTALLLNIQEGNFEETLAGVRQARIMREFTRMREEAAERGFLSDEDIKAEIQACRREKRENTR
jgi:prevent-host-death family protein